MAAIGAASAMIGLPVPIFKGAKELLDRKKLLAPGKTELVAALTEYERHINLLKSLYNNNRALFDQHEVDADLKELAQILRDVDEWLTSINSDIGEKERPGPMELWKYWDLGEKMAASNAKIGNIRARWQVRLQICTLERLDSVQAEMTALFQQMLTMLQQGSVRQHSQVEPAGFNSQTTRVVCRSKL